MNHGDNSHHSSVGGAPNRSYVSNQSSNNRPTTPQNKDDEFIIPTSVKKDKKSHAKRSSVIRAK